MRIDCRECEMYRSQHCDDCLVSSLLGPPGAMEIDEELDPSLVTLSTAGLIPVLRFRPRRAEPDGQPVPNASDEQRAG